MRPLRTPITSRWPQADPRGRVTGSFDSKKETGAQNEACRDSRGAAGGTPGLQRLALRRGRRPPPVLAPGARPGGSSVSSTGRAPARRAWHPHPRLGFAGASFLWDPVRFRDTGPSSPLRRVGKKHPRGVETRRPPRLSERRNRQTLRPHISLVSRSAGSERLGGSRSDFRVP